jgi:hypothetical protein
MSNKFIIFIDNVASQVILESIVGDINIDYVYEFIVEEAIAQYTFHDKHKATVKDILERNELKYYTFLPYKNSINSLVY